MHEIVKACQLSDRVTVAAEKFYVKTFTNDKGYWRSSSSYTLSTSTSKTSNSDSTSQASKLSGADKSVTR